MRDRDGAWAIVWDPEVGRVEAYGVDLQGRYWKLRGRRDPQWVEITPAEIPEWVLQALLARLEVELLL